MDKHFIDFLNLYADAVNGKSEYFDVAFDFEKIVSFAENQGVLSIVMPLLKKYSHINALDSFRNLYNKYLLSVVNNEVKIEKTREILKKIKDNGVKFCLLKGESLACLYNNPQTRISGDTDILIDEKDELHVLDILENEGFSVNHRTPASNHSVCTHERFGCIEVHVKLYYDFMEDIWFKNIVSIKEKYVEKDDVYMLGYTDGYLYVLLHAIKHFISGGLSVRHFSDILLYAKKYKEKIDFTRTDEIIKKLKYEQFEDFVYYIGRKYFDIKNIKKVNDFSPEFEEEIFTDMLKGGIFGKNERERARFFEIYNERRFSLFKSEDFRKYMTEWRRNNARDVLSFSKNNIYKRYPYAKKSFFHYTIALICHLKYVLKKVIKRRKLVKDVIYYKVPEISQNSQKRLELLEKMNMI